jgi:hypothetical protein
MKLHTLLICVLGFGAPALAAIGQQAVSNPANRQATLDLAARLLAFEEKNAAGLPADLVDPFNPAGFGAQAAASPGKPGEVAHAAASDRQILQEIAARINPSGTISFDGQPLLLFREKKLKVGDSLTITFEGTDYVVVIAGIGQSSFKLRLNREEITRPIKPGNVP